MDENYSDINEKNQALSLFLPYLTPKLTSESSEYLFMSGAEPRQSLGWIASLAVGSAAVISTIAVKTRTVHCAETTIGGPVRKAT